VQAPLRKATGLGATLVGHRVVLACTRQRCFLKASALLLLPPLPLSHATSPSLPLPTIPHLHTAAPRACLGLVRARTRSPQRLCACSFAATPSPGPSPGKAELCRRVFHHLHHPLPPSVLAMSSSDDDVPIARGRPNGGECPLPSLPVCFTFHLSVSFCRPKSRLCRVRLASSLASFSPPRSRFLLFLPLTCARQ